MTFAPRRSALNDVVKEMATEDLHELDLVNGLNTTEEVSRGIVNYALGISHCISTTNGRDTIHNDIQNRSRNTNRAGTPHSSILVVRRNLDRVL